MLPTLRRNPSAGLNYLLVGGFIVRLVLISGNFFFLFLPFAAMIGLSTVLGLYNVAAHEHEHGRHDLPYMHIRTKPYPWECSDCNLFSGDCWKACKEGTTEEHH